MTEQPHAVPSAAWALAWSCLAGQLAGLLEGGRQDSNDLVLSIIFGAVVVGWVSYGVLTARGVRVVLVWVVLVLSALAQTVDLFNHPSGWVLVHLAFTAVQLTFFIRFTRTEYYAWQRTRPREVGPPLGALVAVAIAVGALGGVVGAGTDGFQVHVDV